MLPFTPEVFFANMAQYNEAIWPAQAVAYVLGLVIVLLLFRPTSQSSRLIAALLAGAWIWIGVVYHLKYFATINFAAPLFGLAFIIEGLLIAWSGVITRRITFRFRADAAGFAGLTFVTFAIVVYPLLGWLAGHAWPRVAMFGVAPCPTTIFTMGLLLLTEGRTPPHLAIIPVLWSLVGGSAVWLLGVPEDLALPIAGLSGLGLILWKNRAAPRP
jgi:hypothetical protein